MGEVTDPRASLRQSVSRAINANRQSAAKWESLYSWFQSEFGLGIGQVAGKLLTENKQLSNRIKKELPQLSPRYIVLCAIGEDFDLDDVKRHLSGANLPEARCVLLLEGIEEKELIVYEDDGVSERLAEITGLAPLHMARPGSASVETAGGVPAAPPATIVFNPNPVIVDARVRRMVLLAIMSTPAVILVGPPGTGKTTLLSQVIGEIRSDPSKFGLTVDVSEPSWVTPEESWSTADLVGGETVVNGELRFRPGYVLEAIRDNRWLVLDETNRADMDKIFGGLLTWLGGQAVELGRVSKSLDAPAIRLEWGHEAECTNANLVALDAETESAEPVRFVAGTEWRLLGTYNALDAQRVFRFGQAIGRRFARVPIPTPTKGEFELALQPFASGLPQWISTAIVDLYDAHKMSTATELGAALFLRIPAYLQAAQESSPAVMIDSSPSEQPPREERSESVDYGSEQEAGIQEAPEAVPVQEETSDVTQYRALLAEAYVVNTGTWLSRLEPEELEELAARVVLDKQVFSQLDWTWIVDMVRFLG